LNLSENEALLPTLAVGARYCSGTASTHPIPILRLYVVGLLRVFFFTRHRSVYFGFSRRWPASYIDML